MRVRVIFKLKNRGAYLPFHHQHILAQFLKGVMVKGGDAQYFNYSFYNFSGLKGQTKISRSGLHYFSNFVTLVLSSDNQQFLDYLLEQIFEFDKIELGNLEVLPLYTELEQVPALEDNMKFLCISPLVPVKGAFGDTDSKRFIGPESDKFSDLLYESTLQRMEASGQFTDEQLASFSKFQFVPDVAYLNRLKQKDKKFARIYSVFDNDVKYEIRGYTLPFKLFAAKEVQNFVFDCGLGNYTHKGFGMLDIAHADPSERTERYKFSKELVTA